MAQPITGGDFASTFYNFGAGPGQAIAKNRDYYAQLADDAAQAKYREGSLANEQARIAESKRQFEIGQDTPGTIELQGTDGLTYVYPTHHNIPDLAHPYGKAPAATSWNSPQTADLFFKSQDTINNLDATIATLNRGLELSPKAFTGYGAGTAAGIITGMPDAWGLKQKVLGALPEGSVTEEGALATEEYQKILAPEALKSLGESLKGSTSDRDLTFMINTIADPKTSRTVREEYLRTLIAAAKTKKETELARQRVYGGPAAVRGGTPPAPPADGTTPPPAGGATPPPAGGATTGPATPGANRLTAARAAQLQAKIAEINRLPPEQQAQYLEPLRAALTAHGINPAQYGL